MVKISAVIITYNEERTIERCIRSVHGIVDDIVVVDSFSSDRTAEICESLGVRFVTHVFEGYREQKNYATTLAIYDYVLSLDADEALSDELRSSILKVKNDWRFDGYTFNRLNNYCGQWIYHCGWYPDRKVRLFDRRKGMWGGLNLHETIKLPIGSALGHINGDLFHWAYSSIDEHLVKVVRYSTIGSKEYFEKGMKSTFLSAIFHSLWRFFKHYILKQGYKDGSAGFVICAISAYAVFLRYMKLRVLIIDQKIQLNGGKV
ncbi:MAG: glycosyltransferase family 2 protein [Bacteroidales bacterium]|nr:glycosyltransferase family 2 protein [Bacteroidales bacterium]